MAKSKPIKQTASTRTQWEPADWHCITFIGVLTAILFHPILMGKAFLWEDFLYQWYPFRVFAATSMAAGELPLWNPYTFNGMPFLADIQTQIFYLPLTALTLFVSNGHLNSYWLELVNILHYVLAGAGMFYLAKSFNVRQIPALFAGVTYAFSGFMVTHAIHQVMITLVAWYPLILLFFRKSLSGQEWKWVFVTALLLGHSFFAGFPQLSLFFYFFLFVFFVFELLTTFGFRGLTSKPALLMSAKAASIIVLSVGLILVQLLPTLELSQLSVRAEISYQKSTEGSMAWRQLLTLMFPKLFGTAGAEGFNYWGPGTYWYFWETCIYSGLLPLLLSILSVRLWKQNKYVVFFFSFGLFASLFSLGGNFFLQKLFFEFMPGFSNFRNPARMGIFLTFGIALLSAFSLQSILYERKDVVLRKILFGAGAAGAVCWLLIISGTLNGALELPARPPSSSFITSHANVAFFLFAVSLVILYVMVTRGTQLRWIGIAAVLFLFIDLYVFGANQNNSSNNPEEYFKRAEPIVQYVKRQNEIFRLNTRNADGLLVDRNQGMVDRIFMKEGYTPLVLQRWEMPMATQQHQFDLLNIKYMTVTDTQRSGLQLALNPTYLPRAIMMSGVHVARTEQEVADSLKSPTFDYRNVAVIEKEPPIPISRQANPGKATIGEYKNNSITLSTESNGNAFLLLSEIYYPGWNAYIDGTKSEVYRTDYCLRGVFVPAGKHTVVFRFESASFAKGAWATLATLLVCVGGIVVPRFRKKHSDLKSV